MDIHRHFKKIIQEQLQRVERQKTVVKWIDYASIQPIVIGIIEGDGIGPIITAETRRLLDRLLKSEIHKGKVELRIIDGLTIENRAREMKAIPDRVLEEIGQCHALLKGPTTTPKKGDLWPNIESANVALRKALDLFANVRPIAIPGQGIDWIFFRENTEDLYALGSQGVMVTEDMALDFRLATRMGCERIVRLAFAHAKKNGKKRVTAVTKANVIKATDGLFLKVFYEVAAEYPEIAADDWFVDIMSAKLIDPRRRGEFQVLVMPNLYGDILTDEAAEIQGGVGTAGSANIGFRYAMFEAIHGSALRMVAEGRKEYADPSSMMRAAAMLLQHVGYPAISLRLDMSLDICCQYEKKIVVTGQPTGATSHQFGTYVETTMTDSQLESRWSGFVAATKPAITSLE